MRKKVLSMWPEFKVDGWERKLIQPVWGGGGVTVWRFLRKLKIKLPDNPAIPLPAIYPKKKKAEY